MRGENPYDSSYPRNTAPTPVRTRRTGSLNSSRFADAAARESRKRLMNPAAISEPRRPGSRRARNHGRAFISLFLAVAAVASLPVSNMTLQLGTRIERGACRGSKAQDQDRPNRREQNMYKGRQLWYLWRLKKGSNRMPGRVALPHSLPARSTGRPAVETRRATVLCPAVRPPAQNGRNCVPPPRPEERRRRRRVSKGVPERTADAAYRASFETPRFARLLRMKRRFLWSCLAVAPVSGCKKRR